MAEQRWSLIVHGGARTIAAEMAERNRAGCLAAVQIGASILRSRGSALDAAEQAVRALEDDMTFNAGSGSVPTIAGDVEMDAAIMDGSTLDVGAVAALQRVRHPVSVARMLLSEKTLFLVGEGAQAFARQRGVAEFEVPASTDTEPQHDTVGCVAFDQAGRIAAATSTGGLSRQWPGRVGDAPIPGCGFYADSGIGGVAISGDGESIMRVLLAARVMDNVRSALPVDAAEAALPLLDKVSGEAGIVVLDSNGRLGFAHNSDHFALAVAASWLPHQSSGVHRDDFTGIDLNG